MADDIDRAQEINERFQLETLSRHLEKQATRKSRTHCRQCEDPIPQKRQEYIPGVELCVRCQEEQEILENWRPC